MQLKYKHKISLLAFDLDGTLLNSAGRISVSHLHMIGSLMRQGVKVTLCSGRMPYALQVFVQQLGFRGPYVACNGGLVIDSTDDSVLFSEPVAGTDVDQLCLHFREMGLHLCLQTQEGVYYSPGNPRVATPEQVRELAIRYSLPESEIRFLPEDYRYLDKHPVYKVALNVPEGYDFAQLALYLDTQPRLSYAFSDKAFVEINAQGTSKGQGIERVAAHYGIPLQEVCVFGDYDNDIPGFERAGVTIAMGNASDNLKAKAMYVTDTNDNDGIGKALIALAGCI